MVPSEQLLGNTHPLACSTDYMCGVQAVMMRWKITQTTMTSQRFGLRASPFGGKGEDHCELGWVSVSQARSH